MIIIRWLMCEAMEYTEKRDAAMRRWRAKG